MPSSYGIHRADDAGMLSWNYVRDRMASSRNYWVATTRPDGRPHSMPVWGVWLEETFYFATDLSSQKARNLAVSPKVVIHLESADEVVVIEGDTEVVSDRGLLTQFIDAYDAKYRIRPSTGDGSTGVYRLRPLVVFAWLEQDFPGTATRWLFKS